MAKFFNSVTGQMEDDGQPGMDFSNMFAQPTGIPQQVSKPVDPQVAAYLQSKMAKPAPEPQDNSEDSSPEVDPQLPQVGQQKPSLLEQFSPEKYKQALQQSQSRQQDLGFAQLASGIGDALARRDSSGTDKYFGDLRGQIQDQTVGEFNRQKASAIADVGTKQELDSMDPNSEKSVAFRKLVESTMPNIAKSYGKDWDKVAAADGKNILSYGTMRETIDARKQQMLMHQDLKKQELARKNLPEERLKNLSGTDKARYDNALMTLKGIDDMGTALDNGQNTFSTIGDNDYTAAARRATEAYGRMQSGGAINKEEEKRFEKTLPGTTDSKEMQRKKLITQRDEMISRLKTLGFTPEEAGYKPRDFKYGSEARKAPKTIVQNGHTYTFNEATGQYE